MKNQNDTVQQYFIHFQKYYWTENMQNNSNSNKNAFTELSQFPI